MSGFEFSTLLTWGLPLVGLPVLIHLINMLRHRRVPWAAMEFLLQSQKRNRTRVLLKQLLLLAARMAAVALVALLLARPQAAAWLAGLASKPVTHHVVLLDDSFSMSDQGESDTAFQEAKIAVERIARTASERSSQVMTLARFSQAGRGLANDLTREPVDRDFANRVRDKLNAMEPTQRADGPEAVLEAVERMPSAANERWVVYLLSDFRTRQWADAKGLRGQLDRLAQRDLRFCFLQCAEGVHANLAVTSLAPAGPDTRAAKVPLPMKLAVKNFGLRPARNVGVMLQIDGEGLAAARPVRPGGNVAAVESEPLVLLPGITIPEIAPGKTAEEHFSVLFNTAGPHRIVARLHPDAVPADNARYSVVDFAPAIPVLLIDGDPRARDARQLSYVFDPGINTGIKPQIEGPQHLSLKPLDGFRAIYLLNVERLTRSAVDALDRYVRGGGGLAIFAGERCRAEFYTKELYRQGQGLMPVPLDRSVDLPADRLERTADLQIAQYPPGQPQPKAAKMFQVLSGQRNSFLPLVMVHRYYAAPPGWKPEADVHVLATLRNGAPLAVARAFGRGQVVAVLTTAGPTWNNWARENPSYVVAMLDLQGVLSQRPEADAARLVGAAVTLSVDPDSQSREIRVDLPAERPTAAPKPAGDAGNRTAAAEQRPTGVVLEAKPSGGKALQATLSATDASGFYTIHTALRDGAPSPVQRLAVNVDPQEGDVRIVDENGLRQQLPDVSFSYDRARDFRVPAEEDTGRGLRDLLLALLVALLIGEQILAWSASYHPPRRGGAGTASRRGRIVPAQPPASEPVAGGVA